MASDIHSFLVILEKPYNDEDAEEIAKAIRMIRGVIEVTSKEADGVYYVAKSQVRYDMRRQLFGVLEQ